MLYRKNETGRIPIVAVTGTNGKTTVSRLVTHFAKAAGFTPGLTTTDGIYINGRIIDRGDRSGPESAAVVLRDPIVDFAVLECARGGILRAGLGFDQCSISIITNVAGDHLGLNDIHTIEELARVKAVVARSTMENGYSILNADDDLVYNMKDEVDSKIALFSINPHSERIQKHCENGGLAAVIEKDHFVICNGESKNNIIRVADVPLTFSGNLESMTKNVLPAILAAVISNLSIGQIAFALRTFVPSHQLTPGRMNVFNFKNFTLLIDYAHNEAAFAEVKKYMRNVNASRKVGVISAPGDRRDTDIRKIGFYAAEIFDEVIIKHDKDGRGRTNEQITALLSEGIRESKSNFPFNVISNEQEAVMHCIQNAQSNSIVFICAVEVQNTIDFVLEAQKNEYKNQPGEIDFTEKHKAS
jgi:cyanophycin synthetase